MLRNLDRQNNHRKGATSIQGDIRAINSVLTSEKCESWYASMSFTSDRRTKLSRRQMITSTSASAVLLAARVPSIVLCHE